MTGIAIPTDPSAIDDFGDDGAPNKAPGLQRATDGPAIPAPEKKALGFILDEPDTKKVAKHMVQFRIDNAPQRSRNRAVWQRNVWWRDGRRWVRLNKKENSGEWEASLPKGMGSAPPVPNRVDRLCRRLTNTILVDKPYPDCAPGDDTNEAKDAAEFSTRYLTELGEPGNLNMNAEIRAANDKAETFASAFGWVKMDPGGGGHRPRMMAAHPQATHEQDALTDPATGFLAEEDDLQQRYVRSDGYLSDDPDDADLQWLPAPTIRLLTGLQVDFIPATARGMRDAIGIAITDTTTLGELTELFPDAMAKLTQDEIEELVKWKCDKITDLLPAYAKPPEEEKWEDGPNVGRYKPSQVVVVTTIYYKRCAEYPYGCYAVSGGDTLVLHRQRWSAKMQNPAGKMTSECLEIPVAQCRCLDDNTTDNPYGIGVVQEIGPADEIRASALGYELEHMFNSANPHIYIPLGSMVQPGQVLQRNNKPILVNPQGKPEHEQVPALSGTIPLLREEMAHDQDDGIGLQQAAQGVEDPSVKSGIHAQTIVSEALKAVMNIKDNTADYYIALNRIILQLSRAFCEVPTLLSYVGKDGEYKQKEWSRTDFMNTKKVSIAKGSFTMHSLLAKQEMANNAFDRHVIDADDYQDMMTGGISPVLGAQDNPHLLRIRRQLDTWDDGPTPEQVQAYQSWQQTVQAQQVIEAEQAQKEQAIASLINAPYTPTPPAPPPPKPPGAFARALPVDAEPMPAKIRHRQLSRMMASTKFEEQPDWWQEDLLTEYAAMKNAAGVMTVPEVQQAKAAEIAAQPPSLPKGVSIALKGDESNVGAEEQAALAGFSGGAPVAGTPPAGALPSAPAPTEMHFHMPSAQPMETVHERGPSGELLRSITRPHVPVAPAPLAPVAV